jgi:hypothetical protein
MDVFISVHVRSLRDTSRFPCTHNFSKYRTPILIVNNSTPSDGTWLVDAWN